jgi:regulatory protein
MNRSSLKRLSARHPADRAGGDDGFEQFETASQDRSSHSEGAAEAAANPRRTGPSLPARAVGYLSRREHSRAELSRKLAPHALAAGQDEAAVERVLDQLVAKGLLSDARFAVSLSHRRGQRYGTARVMMELRQQGVGADVLAQTQSQLKDTELERAREVWQRKFGQPAGTPAERAKQLRFLQSRGFASEVCYRVVRDSDSDRFDA